MEGGQVLLREKKRGQVIIRRVLSKKGADGRCGGGRWRKGGRGVREMSDERDGKHNPIRQYWLLTT